MSKQPPRKPAPATSDPAADKPARRRPSRALKGEEAVVRRFAIDAARLMADLHCQDVLLLDVRGMSDITDYILVGTGTSDRQIVSVAQNVEEVAQAAGLRRIGKDVDAPASWVVLDFVDVVVHLFEAVTRAHYDLEMLWGDAPRVTWRRRTGTRKAPADEETQE